MNASMSCLALFHSHYFVSCVIRIDLSFSFNCDTYMRTNLVQTKMMDLKKKSAAMEKYL